MLQVGEAVPFFEVTTLDGRHIRYCELWQRRHLLLITIAEGSPPYQPAASRLSARLPELTADDTAVVITPDAIAGVPSPGVLVADRWGEIQHVAAILDAAHMPEPEALLEWREYLQARCPECEGEAR